MLPVAHAQLVGCIVCISCITYRTFKFVSKTLLVYYRGLYFRNLKTFCDVIAHENRLQWSGKALQLRVRSNFLVFEG